MKLHMKQPSRLDGPSTDGVRHFSSSSPVLHADATTFNFNSTIDIHVESVETCPRLTLFYYLLISK